MNQTLRAFAVGASALLSFAAQAGWKGSVSFTPAEISAHRQGLDPIMTTASDCLAADLKRQHDFFARYGIAAFYGDRSSFSKLSTADKRAQIQRLGKNPALLDQMEPTSCVGLTLKCLGKGFRAAGQGAIWNKVANFTAANDQDGTAMQDALQKLGWKIVYWNPNPSHNDAWDAAEKAKNSTNSDYFWGYHAQNYTAAVGPRHRYYLNTVDDWTTLVDFGTSVPADFRKIPFFVGTAHMGYHVFPGSYGQVIEGHSTRAITDPDTVQTSEFNPLKPGGGPRGDYRTGIVAVPPGY